MRAVAGAAGLMLVVMAGLAFADSYTGSGRPAEQTPAPVQPLRSVASFTGYADRDALSRAYFEEAGRVITGPRCMNCHPATRSPTQGDDLHPHIPHVVAGVDDKGAPGLRCISCHHAHNSPLWGDSIRSVPGHAPWALAPASMAWQGKSLGQICGLIKDPARNGGRSLAQIHTHMASDGLVGWAWSPGMGRQPAAGSQKRFGALIEAWIKTGARCPGE